MLLFLLLDQHSLLSGGEIDPLCCDNFGSNLLHTAASNGHLQILQLLSKEVSTTAFQVADSNYLTPAMLAIQVCNNDV